MQALLVTLAAKLVELLWPKFQQLAQEKFDEFAPQILRMVETKLEEWLPKILKTIIVGVAQAAGQITVNATDRVTDIIPGPVDDAIIDPIVQTGMDLLNDILGRR